LGCELVVPDGSEPTLLYLVEEPPDPVG
jgi:hypothetical protein